MTAISSNKTIAKNTVFLYFRMMFSMVVALFTSRINFLVLGVTDKGIYQVVGGLVAMFTFMNGSLAGATSRFLTYELGRGDNERLKKTFSAALNIHILVAIIVLVLAETIGLWFLENKLVIPEERMNAARIVYQLSVFSCMISITQVPYNASIISHEKMNVFAYMGILGVLLNLLACYLLYITPFDRLLTFGVLMLFNSVLLQMIYRWYCHKNFSECRLRIVRDKSIVKPILNFSGWDLVGNFSVMARGQGVNIILNMFFGPAINAACGFSNTVGGAVLGFSNNFMAAIRPPIVKAYSIKDYVKMENLMINASKYSFCLLLLLSTPIIFESTFVFTLWLKTPPPYTDVFCMLVLILNCCSMLFYPLVFAIHASGRIRFMSVVNGSIWFTVVPITYVLLYFGFSPVVPYLMKLFLLIFVVISNFYSTKRNIPAFDIPLYFHKAVLPCALVCIIVIPITCLSRLINVEQEWLRFLITASLSTISISLCTYYIILSKENRKKVLEKIKSFRKRS